jgi:hypothetical protein
LATQIKLKYVPPARSKMSELILIIQYIAYGSFMFPVVIYLLLGDFRLKYINLLIVLSLSSFLADSICIILVNQKAQVNRVVNVQDIIQFGIIIVLYWKFLLKDDDFFKINLKYLLLIYFLTTAIFWKGLSTIQNFSWMTASVVTTLIGMRHVRVISQTQIFGLGKFAPFWISAGLVLYCSFTLCLISMLNYMEQNLASKDFRALWMFHNICCILKNICFTLAVWYGVNRNPPLLKRFFSNN